MGRDDGKNGEINKGEGWNRGRRKGDWTLACRQTQINTHALALAPARPPAHQHARPHARMHAHTHARTHARTHIVLHIHTPAVS